MAADVAVVFGFTMNVHVQIKYFRRERVGESTLCIRELASLYSPVFTDTRSI